MLRVGPVGFGVSPTAAKRGSISRLGQVRANPGAGQLLSDITPPGTAFECQMHLGPAGHVPCQPVG
jgi:hypothetical protein